MNLARLPTHLARGALSIAIPIFVWGTIVLVGWAVPFVRPLLSQAGLVLLIGALIGGFSVLAVAYRLWVAVVLACFYFPLMYIVVMYFEAFAGYGLYGTTF